MNAPAIDLTRLTHFRRELHQWPELGFQEHDTARRVKTELDRLGVDYEDGIGGTGIVATLRGTLGGEACVGLRADMDALPMAEQSGVEHSSRNPGCMHACGHDGHTTMLLGAIEELLARPDYPGTIHCIFQPAEEGVGGARAMLDDGLFERFPVKEVYGLHNWPALPVGQFGLIPGPIMASGDKIDIVIHGKGGHGGLNPHGCIDPVRIASELIQKAHTIIGREIDPMAPAVLSICAIEAGQLSGFNVIPDTARMSGTIRAIAPAVADRVRSALRRLCSSLEAYYDITIELTIDNKFPATVNDPAATALARGVITDTFGEETLAAAYQASMASEDFAFMLEQCPGAYIHVGAGDDEHPWGLHNPKYDFNDRILPMGVQLLAGLARASLQRQLG